ncbi:MAG: hypothetical protein WD670_09515 [Actinomycetota bacterium]
MRIAPAGRTLTAREPAATVADDDRAAERRRDHLGAPPHVERFGSSLRDHARHVRIAGHPPGGLRGDRADIFELGPSTSSTFQRLQVDGDHDVRSLAGHRRAID